ncbi:MAG: FHA domain-containing protein [Oscillospiraceae bacterium]|nr:FHA domain-containing protein [Oscillospiraceae bacterium]
MLALQIRLKDLQYYEGLVLVPEKYDEDLQKAIDRFCETNAISYDRSGITPAVQQLIYSQGAIPYTAPAEQRSLAEKFTAYMMQDADLLVIVVPVFVVWILIMFVVLIAAVFTMQRLQQKKAIKDANQGPQDTREIGAGKGSKNMPPPPVEMRKMIQFQIDYQGKTWNLEKDASCPLTIGRGNAEIRLDSSDRSASRKHCVLFFKGAVLMLQDVSVNGTYINDSVFHKCTTPVQSGDCIVIGSHHIFLRF